MEYALVHLTRNNTVVDKVTNGDHRFPVHPDFKWIRCNSDVGPGWTFYEDTNAFIEPPYTGLTAEEKIRHDRNKILKKCDWKMLRANETGEKVDEWKSYRQALRDITESQKPYSIDKKTEQLVGVTWPTDPDGNSGL